MLGGCKPRCLYQALMARAASSSVVKYLSNLSRSPLTMRCELACHFFFTGRLSGVTPR